MESESEKCKFSNKFMRKKAMCSVGRRQCLRHVNYLRVYGNFTESQFLNSWIIDIVHSPHQFTQIFNFSNQIKFNGKSNEKFEIKCFSFIHVDISWFSTTNRFIVFENFTSSTWIPTNGWNTDRLNYPIPITGLKFKITI